MVLRENGKIRREKRIIKYFVFKVGVAVVDDSKKLLVDHNLEVAGCVDLRHLAVRQARVELN